MGPLTQRDVRLGFHQLQILVIWGPYRHPDIVVCQGHAKTYSMTVCTRSQNVLHCQMLEKLLTIAAFMAQLKSMLFNIEVVFFSSILETTQGGGDITTGLDLGGMAISKAAKAGVNSSTKTVVIKRNTIMGETCLEKYQQQRYSNCS